MTNFKLNSKRLSAQESQVLIGSKLPTWNIVSSGNKTTRN